MFSRSLLEYSCSSSKELLNFQKPGPLGCLAFSDLRYNVITEWSVSGAFKISHVNTSLTSILEIRKKSKRH